MKSKITLEKYFKINKASIHKNKFVIILGSGFHIEAFSNVKKEKNYLNSWKFLLQKLGSRYDLNSQILEFEQIIKNKTRSQNELAAHKIEKKMLEKCASLIKSEQKKSIKNIRYQELSKIFNPEYVSDVINLNFDYLLEDIIGKNDNIKRPKKIKDISTFSHTSNNIRFWYPHGIVSSPESMILSLRNYGNNIKSLELMRQNFKAKESQTTKSKLIPETWFDQLMRHPVIIIGADISQNEWDIWFALVNRERNFSKKVNQKYKTPVFKMRDKTCKEYEPSDADILFNELFEISMSFTKQWDLLISMFQN